MQVKMRYDGEPEFEFTDHEIGILAWVRASEWDQSQLVDYVASDFVEQASAGDNWMQEFFLSGHAEGPGVTFQDHMNQLKAEYDANN